MTSDTHPANNDAFSPEGVTEQLDRILSSDTFTDAPRLQQFLDYVVNETLHGRSSHIKGFTIAHDVFKRANPIDAQDSTIVRVEAGRLRRRLKDYYTEEGKQDPIHIRIPKGGYVPVFEELPPPTEENADDKPATRPPGTRRPSSSRTGILAFIAIMLALFALFRIFNLLDNENLPGGNNALPTKPAIAVLPFVDTTTDRSGTSLATGLTEDIITDLSSLDSIDVIALSSVLPYRGTTMPPQQIATELNVSHILRGSIRGNVNQLRVTTELFDANSGRQVWADRFDRKLENELSLERELSLKVIEGLATSFRGEELDRLQRHRNIQNNEVHSLFKQAMNLANPPSDPHRLRTAGRVFSEVIEIAPDFAGGYAGAAYIHAFLVWWGHSESADEDTQKAVALANKALELDPDFGLAYSALAFTYLHSRDFDKALTASRQAIRVQPNDPYVAAYHGFILSANGQPEEGIPFAIRAIRLDPVFPRTPYRNILGVIYFHAGRYQEALDSFVRSDELGGPRSPGLLAYKAATYALLGREQEARVSFDLLTNYNGDFDWKDWLHRANKNEQYAEQVLQPLAEFERDLE
jgi:TolB-like protein